MSTVEDYKVTDLNRQIDKYAAMVKDRTLRFWTGVGMLVAILAATFILCAAVGSGAIGFAFLFWLVPIMGTIVYAAVQIVNASIDREDALVVLVNLQVKKLVMASRDVL